MSMRVTMVAALCVAGLATAASAQEIRRVTLAEALDLAVRAQPAMVQARQSLRVAEADQRQATGAFLPNLSFTSGTSKSGATRLNQASQPQQFPSLYSNSFGFNSSWDVFTGFRRGARRSQTSATTRARDAALLRQEYLTVLETKRTFFQTLAFAELVNVQQTRLRSAEEQLRLTTERLRLGATTRSDSLRAQVERGQALLALIQAQDNLRAAQSNLGRALQVEGLVMGVYDSSLEARFAELDTAALRRDAHATAPSIRAAEATLAAAQAGRRVATSSYWPAVTLSGGWSKIAADTVPYGGRYLESWNFRLGVNLPIFDRFQREYSVTTANVAVENARAELRDARLALDANLTQALSTFVAAAARIDVARTSVQASQEDLRLQRERYRLGAVTIIEVLASQATLDQAQVDLVQARYDYLVARAEIEALIGRSL